MAAKVTSATGRPAMILSDDSENTISNPTKIARYLRTTGQEARASTALTVLLVSTRLIGHGGGLSMQRLPRCDRVPLLDA